MCLCADLGRWQLEPQNVDQGIMSIEQEFGVPPLNIVPQESPLPLETKSQSADPVIPDEHRLAGRDPESSAWPMMSAGFWFPAFAGTLSGSRLAPRSAGLGRDDELSHSRVGVAHQRQEILSGFRPEFTPHLIRNQKDVDG
jgi:hypothetical protein